MKVKSVRPCVSCILLLPHNFTFSGGRLISNYILNEPLHVDVDGVIWHVPVVEIPAPKLGRTFVSGWEHAEFVVSEWTT
jgi:predicted metalloenzyme YecM